MRPLARVLFWSVIAAAFIGPGTVTTCARAGSAHGLALLWAVLFSTIACLVLQEASARLTAISGKSLGEALRAQHGGMAGTLLLVLVLGAVVGGCAAYQAGNLAGAAAGSELVHARASELTIVAALVFAAALLWTARAAFVAKLLGVVVAVMGACFAVTAVALQPAPTALLRGALVPTVPEGAGWLVVAVIGTTVVPYNLFLGSGLAVGHSVRDVRIGLGVSVVAGGLVSMAVLVVGGSLVGEFSVAALAARLGTELGGWARGLFALGLFCAGLTSAITAPLAAAITARGLFAARGDERWSESSTRYRGVWIVVLVTGSIFALTTARPVQLIVAAQALNGVLLPVVAIFLMIAVNDRRLMGADGLNGALANALSALVVFVALTIGLSNLIAASVGRSAGLESIPWLGALAATALTSPFVARAARRRRMEDRSP